MHHLPQELNETRSIFFVKNTREPVPLPPANVEGKYIFQIKQTKNKMKKKVRKKRKRKMEKKRTKKKKKNKERKKKTNLLEVAIIY